MSRRGKFWLQISLSLYGLMLVLYVYGVLVNRDLVTLPELVRDAINLPGKNDPELKAQLDEVARPGYRAAEALGGLQVGDRRDWETLRKLVEQGVVDLLVYDPIHLRRLARAQLKSGKNYRVGNRNLVEVGDVLDEDTLVRLALLLEVRPQVLEDGGKIFIQGHGQLWGVNATFIFVWLNLLALTGILYAVFWEPLRRVIAERQRSIAEEIHAAEKVREEAEVLRKTLEDRLARLDEGPSRTSSPPE